MLEWFTQFTPNILHVVGALNVQDLGAIFAVAMLTEFGVPFPLVLDSLLVLLGYQITSSWFTAIIVVGVLMAGREAGSTGVFWLSRSIGKPLLAWIGRRLPFIPRLADRVSHRLRLHAALAVATSRLGVKAGMAAPATALSAGTPFAVAITRLVPGLLSVTSIAAGLLGFRYKHFTLGIALASLISDAAEIGLGVATGFGLRQFSLAPSPFFILGAVAIDILVVILLQRWWWKRTSRQLAAQAVETD